MTTLLSKLHLFVDVSVSVPAMVSVGEGDGMVQVCATLSTVEDTERDFTITLATSDGTGTEYHKVL